MSKKLTDWLSADVKPVHIGWYERDWEREYLNLQYDWWNGNYWEYGAGNGIHQGKAKNDKKWRGLAEKP